MQRTAAAPTRATQDVRAPLEVLATGPSRAERQAVRQHPTILRRLTLPSSAPPGEGRAHATIVWLYLATYLRWSGEHSKVWPSDETISKRTGLSLRAVQRGLAYLRAIGKITITRGQRPASRRKDRRKVGRVIEMHLLGDGPNPVVLWPSPKTVVGIWRECTRTRNRPAALVGLALAMHVLAAAEQGAELTEAVSLTASMATIRSLVGAAHGATFNRRLAGLERAGLLARVGTHWRSGAIVKLPPQAAPRPIPKLLPTPMLRVFAQPPAANDGPTLEEVVALEAEMAAALGWRAGSIASQPRRTGTGQPRALLQG
jgi:hypothetical protein